MPPRARAKPAAGLAGLAASDSEPDLDMFDKSDLQAAVRSVTKKPRGRPPGSASKITKPASRATRQANSDKLPTVSESDAQPAASGKATASGTKGTRKAQQISIDETLPLEDVGIPSSAPATDIKKGTRGRPKKTNGDTSILAPESAVKRRGRPPRQPTTPIAEVPETQQDPMELDPVLEADEDDGVGEPPSIEAPAPWQSYNMSDDTMRRQLEDLTRKYTALEARHRDLRDVGVREAERNFERLKKQAEERTAEAATKLIAELKAELAAQTALANESEELRKQLVENEAETENLENTIQTLNGSLSDAKSEIKTLSNKLAAARSAENNSRVPGSAMKASGLANRTAQAGAAHAAQATALAKERLYADLTDLILRGVKQEEMEDTFDCIQTGRNGTLHFKLVVENDDAADNYDDVSFTYQPQLDAGRDQQLIDMLPGYLTEEITFPRSQALKFYARVNKSLTEDLTR
ncbi:uncharacterized protein FIESC28_04337 [Fusarium coffeatum]|uniref:Monopolin complex subunit Csm1/Pcs1 C-terminal domain-containing protein n=1 Tax=Fusarium coffeatum TaxID=231269 RepID=A0A366S0E6_9HYPO|nr:uncharacterized protein FIESC28_04337 [Fusarium coffeatum]RBR22774.1 hypothetical protein FIESC28_04337 [Fusarium coffeatum]